MSELCAIYYDIVHVSESVHIYIFMCIDDTKGGQLLFGGCYFHAFAAEKAPCTIEDHCERSSQWSKWMKVEYGENFQ